MAGVEHKNKKVMTTITINFEDKFLARLKQKADNIGYSIDNYILHLLAEKTNNTNGQKSQDSVEALLSSMQFNGVNIPASEDGKGNVAELKYM